MVAIREAQAEDLPQCAALHAIYVTWAAWQLNPAKDAAWFRSAAGPTTAPDMPMLNFHLQQVRLPRQRALMLPSSAVPLAEVWHTYHTRLVAEDDDARLCGYLLIQLLPDQQQAWIARLLVDVSQRGQGIGKALIRAARVWGRAQPVLSLTAHAPLRNVPGIAFYQRCGFTICGLLEHFYPTREDSLLLSRPL